MKQEEVQKKIFDQRGNKMALTERNIESSARKHMR